MKEQIKELRVSIDGLAQLTKELNPVKSYSIGERCTCECHIPGSTMIHFVACCHKGMIIGTEKTFTEESTEINKAYDSLILAKAWLGKVLQELGESTPYVNDGSRKEVKDIEPAADTYEVKLASTQIGEIKVSYPEYSDLLHMNHIEKVDWLRQEINILHVETTSKLNQILFNMEVPTDSYTAMNEYRTYIKKYLSEARFWLGFELGRIRDIKQIDNIG